MLASAKQRAMEQWSTTPCGSDVATTELGTQAFFDEARTFRYADAPWMRRVLGFDRHAGAKVLEVGVGMGSDYCEWLRGGANAIGIDLTPRHIALARANAESLGYQPTIARADAEDLPFGDGEFDVVYSFGVLHHTPNTARAIDEVWRVLRPGGIARVMVYYRHSENYWLNMVARHGLLRGELLRNSVAEILSRWAETPDSSARPLVKVYSKREARTLFARFTDVDCSVYQLTERARRALAPFGERTVHWFERRVGWNLVIEARK